MLPHGILVNPIMHAIVANLIAFAPFGAVLLELGAPVVLIWTSDPKSVAQLTIRKISLLVGALFHAVLALPPSPLSVYPFSAIMVPLYVMILPEDCGLSDLVQRVTAGWWKKAIGVALIALGHRFAPQLLFNEQELFEYPNYGLWGVSLVWNLIGWTLLIASLVKSLLSNPKKLNKGKSSTEPAQLRLSSKLLILFLFGFAMTPYIGLRNYPALAMFSNLRTEGSNPNSWNVFEVDLFEYQKDYVTVTHSNMTAIHNLQVNLGDLFPDQLKHANDLFNVSNEFYICPPQWPHPEKHARMFKSFNIPFIELRRRIAHVDWTTHAPITVAYTRHHTDGRIEKGVMFNSSQAKPDDEIMKRLSLFEKYFVRFRSFSNEYSPCRH